MSAQQPTTLVLVRHGESIVTVNRVIGGHRTCSGLSELGRRQAERLGARLRSTHELVPDVLISSDFPRAIETAEIITPAIGDLPIAVDAGFGEHDPGPDIDGMTFVAYVERYGAPDWSDPNLDIFPGGETVGTFQQRVGEALERTLSAHAGSCILVSCHGGVIDATFRHLLQTPATGAFELHTLNTSISQFVSTGRGSWRLARYNDAAHLNGLPTETPRVESS